MNFQNNSALRVMASAAVMTVVPRTHAAVQDDVVEKTHEEEDEKDRSQASGKSADDDYSREVTVTTASRTEQAVGDTAVTTEVVGRERIEASGAENLAEVLEEVPGMQVTRSFAGAGIRMQGLDPRYTLILIDGQRVTGRISGTLDLTRIPAEDIEQVEIVQGPSSSLYGSDAIAGVVNVITRKTKRPYEAEVHAALGSFWTTDVSARAGLRRKRFGAQLTGGWHRTDGYTLERPDRPPEDASTTGSWQNTGNVALQTDFTPNTPADLRISTRVDYQLRDIRRVDFSPPRANYDRQNLTHLANVTITPEIRWNVPARLRLIGRFAYFDDTLTTDQRLTDDGDSVERTVDKLGEITAQYDQLVAAQHMLSFGFVTSFEDIDSDRVSAEQRARQRVSLYVQDEWQIARTPRVVLVPSSRLDYDTQFGGALTPKVALRLDPTQWLTLRASYGAGFRAPDFKELYLQFANPAAGYRVAGNPQLNPERSRGANAGVDLKLWEWGSLSAAYFHNSIDGLITTPTGSALVDGDGTLVFQYVNLSEVQTQGVDLRGGATFLKHFGADLGYTYTLAYDLSPDDEGRPQVRDLPGRPRHRGNVRLWFHHRRIGTRVQLRGAVFGGQQFYRVVSEGGDSREEQVTLAPYAVLDIRVAQEFLKHYAVFLGVDNLLNAGDPDFLPLVPRSFYGGLTLRY